MKMNLFFSLPYELQLMIRDILKKDFNQKKCILEKNLHFPEVDFTFSRPVYTNGSVYEVRVTEYFSFEIGILEGKLDWVAVISYKYFWLGCGKIIRVMMHDHFYILTDAKVHKYSPLAELHKYIEDGGEQICSIDPGYLWRFD